MVKGKFDRDVLTAMDPMFLRALIRERAHHTLESKVYSALCDGDPVRPDLGDAVQEMLAVVEDRGLPTDSADLQWVYRLLDLAEALKPDERPDLDIPKPEPFSTEEMRTVEKLIRQRRSIREVGDEDVPAWMIKKIVEAGLWAPHACNLQNIRVIVIDDAEGLALFAGKEHRGFRAAIVVCQDMRSYEFYAATVPERNHGLDCGAATQNMLLMAHALGLGATWMTFTKSEMQRIREHYELPDFIRIVTYIGLGWPRLGALAPGRIAVEEAILGDWPG